MAISASESLESFVTGRTDGTISRYSLDEPAISWRSKYESEFLVSRDGSSQLRNPALEPLEVSVDGASHEIGEKEGGKWLLPRPDGLGGVFTDGNKWAVKVGSAPSKFYDTPSADYASYSSHLTRCRCVWCFLGYYPRFCCGGGMSCCIIFTGALE